MMKLARTIIALCMSFLFSLPVLAEGYSMLVIPNSAIDTTKKNTVGNVDIEELLARKFIDKFEYTGRAFAPTIRVLKISIMNNPEFKPNAVNPINNAKILSNSYGVPNVLIVSSKTQVVNSAKQKDFWNKLDLPVIANNDTNLQLVTTITLLNTKTNEIVWSDTYYKKLNLISMGNTKTTKIEYINSYYDELISKVVDNMRETKETHAIMLTNQPAIKETKPSDTTASSKVKKQNTVEKVSNTKISPNLSMIEDKENKKESRWNIKTSQLFKNKNKTAKIKDKNFLSKMKDSIQLKYDSIKEEKEIENIRKQELKTASDKKKDTTEIKKQKTEKIKVSKDNKQNKTVQNWIKEKKQKSALEKAQKELAKSTEQTEKNKKISIKKPKTEAVKKETITANKEKKEFFKVSKIKKEKPQKTEKTKIGEKIKTKFANIKAKHNENKANKLKNKEENLKYSNVLLQDEENTSSANKYINTKPRNNSRNYVPKFDESVNDI